jgi:hypothetical protein
MHKRQAGITFIGWLVLLVPVAIVVYGAIRLLPVYMNHFKVSKVVEQAADESSGEPSVNAAEVRRSIQRRLDIEGVEFPTLDEIKVARDGDQWAIEVDYERVAPLFGAINLLVVFNKRVVIQ